MLLFVGAVSIMFSCWKSQHSEHLLQPRRKHINFHFFPLLLSSIISLMRWWLMFHFELSLELVVNIKFIFLIDANGMNGVFFISYQFPLNLFPLYQRNFICFIFLTFALITNHFLCWVKTFPSSFFTFRHVSSVFDKKLKLFKDSEIFIRMTKFSASNFRS